MVYTVLIILHLFVCVFLIFIVLIQSSKGAELGAAFGGSNQTLFGSRGAATFMNKLTTGTAVAFMLTSLLLAVLSFNRGSVMPETTAPQAIPDRPTADAPTGPIGDQPSPAESTPAPEAPAKPSEPSE